MTIAIEAPLQFVLPEEVMPLEVSSIEMWLDIKAPQRDVTISVTTNDGSVEMADLKGPSIPWSGTTTDPQVLASMADGILDVRLSVSERTDLEPDQDSSNVVAWQVEAFHASIRGTTAGAAQ